MASNRKITDHYKVESKEKMQQILNFKLFCLVSVESRQLSIMLPELNNVFLFNKENVLVFDTLLKTDSHTLIPCCKLHLSRLGLFSAVTLLQKFIGRLLLQTAFKAPR